MTAPNRRWLRFSLRTLFVACTVLGIVLGLQLMAIRERQKNIDAIWEDDGVVCTKAAAVSYGWEFVDDTYWIPFWRRWLGDKSIALVMLKDNSSLRYVNQVHALFPEAAIVAYTAEEGRIELRPGDPPVAVGSPGKQQLFPEAFFYDIDKAFQPSQSSDLSP